MIKKNISNLLFRLILFTVLSIIPLLPFILNGTFQMDWDAWFHFSRIYEIAQDIQHGKLIPDVSYFTFNNQGYAVNFFYPYFVNYPIALIFLLTGKPVTTIYIYNILFHILGLEIAYQAFNKLRSNTVLSFSYAILYIFGIGIFNTRMLSMGTYNQQLAFVFLPFAIIGIYEMIAGDYKKWYKYVIISVSLITLTHLLTTYLLVFYTLTIIALTLIFNRRLLNLERIINWLISGGTIVLLTLLFILPLFEQKKANNWLDLPALNLGSNGILSKSAESVSLWNRLSAAFNLQDLIILFFIIAIIAATYDRTFDKHSKLLLWGIAGVSILQSNLIPYYILQRYSFIDMIQYLNRFDIFLYGFVTLFIAIVLHNTVLEKSINPNKILLLTFTLYALFCSQNFLKEKNILSGDVSDFDRISYLGTNDNVLKGLSHSNFGYFGSDAGKGYYRVNGFMDYRTKEQIKRIPNGKNGYKIDSGEYKIKNGDSFAPIINFDKNYQVSTNDFIENAVYFDGQRHFKNFSQHNFTFYVKHIPKDTKIVRTPITYLKGFEVKDNKGIILDSYKDKNGWLAVKKPTTSTITIIYKKTLLHKLSIGLSITTWISMIALFFRKTTKNEKTNELGSD
ncbi:hypothetical protein MKL29_10270 [Streptococcus suis]|nr:hypothetical protein [Streptococcus suis]